MERLPELAAERSRKVQRPWLCFVALTFALVLLVAGGGLINIKCRDVQQNTNSDRQRTSEFFISQNATIYKYGTPKSYARTPYMNTDRIYENSFDRKQRAYSITDHKYSTFLQIGCMPSPKTSPRH